MKKINVIDLDKTLIPYDSFRLYVINKIKSGNVRLAIAAVLRKLRFIQAEDFKKKALFNTQLLKKTEEIDKITSNILCSINEEVLEIIKENSDEDIINILCSASPDAYVKKVAEHFNWIGYGSYFNGIDFYHMWGENKLRFIESKYPSNKYIYNFAISDSESDLKLLKQFKKYELVK
jgi:phosphoserine phosphatase